MARMKTYGEIKNYDAFNGYVYKANGKLFRHASFYEFKSNALEGAKRLKEQGFTPVVKRLPDGRTGVFYSRITKVAKRGQMVGVNVGALTKKSQSRTASIGSFWRNLK